MPHNLAPLLPADVIAQAKILGAAIRNAEVAPLVGGGASISCGLPSWGKLIDLLILAWREYDTSSERRRLSPENYVRFLKQNFQGDLAIASYLRHQVNAYRGAGGKPLSFGELLFSALYSSSSGGLYTPEPTDLHRHLVCLFRSFPKRLWTTNYDDLLEEAARSMRSNFTVGTVDAKRRQAAKGLQVAHLHGFLAPLGRTEGHPDPNDADPILTLSEDDYHLISSDILGWTNREFHRLFDEYRVLIVGMSMDDPNVRRVLATSSVRPTSSEKTHFAIMFQANADDLVLPRVSKKSGLFSRFRRLALLVLAAAWR